MEPNLIEFPVRPGCGEPTATALDPRRIEKALGSRLRDQQILTLSGISCDFGHRYREVATELVVCLSGRISVYLLDIDDTCRGGRRVELREQTPREHRGLVIPPRTAICIRNDLARGTSVFTLFSNRRAKKAGDIVPYETLQRDYARGLARAVRTQTHAAP